MIDGQGVENGHALEYAMDSTPIIVDTYRAYIFAHGGLVSDACHVLYFSLLLQYGTYVIAH